ECENDGVLACGSRTVKRVPGEGGAYRAGPERLFNRTYRAGRLPGCVGDSIAGLGAACPERESDGPAGDRHFTVFQQHSGQMRGAAISDDRVSGIGQRITFKADDKWRGSARGCVRAEDSIEGSGNSGVRGSLV